MALKQKKKRRGNHENSRGVEGEGAYPVQATATNNTYSPSRRVVIRIYISRCRQQGLALYTSIDSDIAEKQIAARRKHIRSRSLFPTIVSIETTIAVLVEALRAGRVLTAASTVAARLSAQGVVITVDQVEQIFSQYGLKAEKKMAEQP